MTASRHAHERAVAVAVAGIMLGILSEASLSEGSLRSKSELAASRGSPVALPQPALGAYAGDRKEVCAPERRPQAPRVIIRTPPRAVEIATSN
jgi:hypothetical protein